MSRFLIASVVSISCFTLVGTGALFAGSQGSPGASISELAEREVARRQANLQRAEVLMAEGRKARKAGDMETAYVNFLDAVELIPAGDAGLNRRRPAINEFSAVALEYAHYLIDQGRFTEAEQVAKTILLPQFNPTYRPAVQLLSQLEQPDYFNKTITPEFAAQREEVIRLLQEAEGFYASGRYDLSTKRYNQVLEIDPYNKAARRGMQEVDVQRTHYYSSAYNQTRSQMLWEVAKSWETPVPRSARGIDQDRIPRDERGTEAIISKLNRIIIPQIILEDRTLRDAVAILQQQSVRLDTTPDEEKRGVNIVLNLDSRRQQPAPPTQDGFPAPAEVGPTPDTRVNLILNHVPLYEALRYLGELTGLRVKVDPFAVSLVPLSEAFDSLVTREYRVPPGFIPPSAPDDADAFGALPIRGGAAARPEPVVRGRVNAQQFLEENGVQFPPGSTARYIAAGSRLVVRNTPDNIDLIENIVNAAVGVTPTQVEIESKFLEISQNNLAELGFDWLMGPVAIGDGVYLSGGDTRLDPANFIFPTEGQSSLTRGLRMGSGANPQAAITTNSIDALLAAGVGGSLGGGRAPGIFGIGGIFTNPQFEVVIRALDQKKGVDLLSAPKVTTKSGQRANVRIVRKFWYPTQFTPPQIPTDTGSTTSSGGAGFVVDPTSLPPPTITPAFPDAFEPRDVGVILDVEPTVGADSYTIDLNLRPEVVDFDGFINYGSPINTVGYQFDAFQGIFVPTSVTLTENVINQPIFSSRRVETNVTIWDGQTVALGGLMREDVQKVQDKVPILGDIPLAGRLFRSNVDQKIKKNLIIFVTAQILDAEGRPIRRTDDEEDFVDPLGLPEGIPGPSFPAYKGGGVRYK